MAKSKVQEERMKGFFVQAAQEILKGEGLKAASVRNIAEKAGYSYATLYNYFSDAKDLIFECIKVFQEECEWFVRKETVHSKRGLDKIEDVISAYVRYFIQYPGLFELFYLERPGDLANKQDVLNSIHNLLDKICMEEWIYCIQNGTRKMDEAERMKTEIRYLVPGMLLIYLNRRRPETYQEFKDMLSSQIHYILYKE